jgi:hypothetical protein
MKSRTPYSGFQNVTRLSPSISPSKRLDSGAQGAAPEVTKFLWEIIHTTKALSLQMSGINVSHI